MKDSKHDSVISKLEKKMEKVEKVDTYLSYWTVVTGPRAWIHGHKLAVRHRIMVIPGNHPQSPWAARTFEEFCDNVFLWSTTKIGDHRTFSSMVLNTTWRDGSEDTVADDDNWVEVFDKVTKQGLGSMAVLLTPVEVEEVVEESKEKDGERETDGGAKRFGKRVLRAFCF
ncbi:uncharacterized protein LTR77_002651 [Saxophila tyrrhenica]|uniref:Uncharacterized protein n=1 Tax=Saxophila tyrrhenica TaxID=1690608 RepID=A0AAV9PG07_9PEZI|nr:hypothetical protein LTR77_002651 [Saxophila tyrrhenica]